MLGRRQDAVGLPLPQRLAPFGLSRFDTDGGDAYERQRHPEQPQRGKEHTQKSASTPSKLRTQRQR